MLAGASCQLGQQGSAENRVPTCAGTPPTIVGTSEPDVLRGTPGRDVIAGLEEDDVLIGLAGNDLICGGPGDDRVVGDAGFDELIGGSGDDRCDSGPDVGTRRTCEDPTILAAGDIACSPDDPADNAGAGTEAGCRYRATAEILDAHSSTLVAVLALGDLQYEEGTLDAFRTSFDPSWGRYRSLMHPVPGNNEYQTPDAAGYFAYFGAAAGREDRGFYSFDREGWHFVALNSQCWLVGGCGEADAQARWLERDLARSDARCTVAFFHHPRFSSAAPTENGSVEAIWQVMHAAGVDLVLNGHNHHYERFAPQDATGSADPDRGIRQFIVGTGGVSLHPFPTSAAWRANSEVRDDQTYGVLELTIHPTTYEWRFIPVAGGTFTDAGVGACV